jgi:TRAP-type C4-dicarboxylate transport system substrate-binding protein
MEKRGVGYFIRVFPISLILSLIAFSPLRAEEVKWTFYTYLPSTDRVVSLYRSAFDDLLKSSNGRFKIALNSAGELPYKPVDAIKITASNQVQMADAAVGFVAGDAPELNVLSMPFLCTTFDGYFKTIQTIAPIFNEDLMQRFKIGVLFNWTNPPQNIWTTKPVKTLEDLRGMKIRAWNPEQVTMLRLLGATPVSIASDEVPSSLQRKVIDGAITSALSVSDWKLYQFVSYGLIINFSIGNQFVLMNMDQFDKLPKDLQQLLRQKGDEWYLKFKESTPKFEMDARKNIQEKGITFNELSPADFEKAQKIMRPMWEEWANKNGPIAQKLLAEVTKVMAK